jgi:hypothetical protein
VYWDSFQQWLFGTRLMRRLADTLFRGRARRHLATIDHEDPARTQLRTLQGLVHQAHATRFGREHDFRRIRTPADFRRLVPLRSLTDFWHDYWQPPYPRLSGITWPGPISTMIAGPWGGCPWIPASPALWAGHYAAGFTTLSLVTAARPQSHLFSGRTLIVGEGQPLTRAAEGIEIGALEWLAPKQFAPRHRAYIHAPPICTQPVCPAEARLRTLANRSAGAALTCVAGEAETLMRFFSVCKQETGWSDALDVWPHLSAVIYSSDPGRRLRARLASQIGSSGGQQPILLLEACFQPEGAIAIEDPRHGRLRLLADHGVYFEFVPVEELTKARAARHGVGEVVPGVLYAVALSSGAGVWSCLAGVRVIFESRNPPLLSVVESPTSASACSTTQAVSLLPASHATAAADGTMNQGPHRHSSDNPEERRETNAHSPWSTHADRE